MVIPRDNRRAPANSNFVKAYIAGSSLIILGAPNELIQSIALDNDAQFTAVIIDVATGKIAASTGSIVYVYQPFGQDVGALKV